MVKNFLIPSYGSSSGDMVSVTVWVDKVGERSSVVVIGKACSSSGKGKIKGALFGSNITLMFGESFSMYS